MHTTASSLPYSAGQAPHARQGAAYCPAAAQIPDEHEHFSHRAPWLRAGVLGANDGLVSVASLMLGVGGGSDSLHLVVLAGVAGLVGGALSMAVGEYISVSSQRRAPRTARRPHEIGLADAPAGFFTNSREATCSEKHSARAQGRTFRRDGLLSRCLSARGPRQEAGRAVGCRVKAQANTRQVKPVGLRGGQGRGGGGCGEGARGAGQGPRAPRARAGRAGQDLRGPRRLARARAPGAAPPPAPPRPRLARPRGQPCAAARPLASALLRPPQQLVGGRRRPARCCAARQRAGCSRAHGAGQAVASEHGRRSSRAGRGLSCPSSTPWVDTQSTWDPFLPTYCKRQQYGSGGRLRWQVAEELTAKDVIKAHARDELGIDIDELSKPLQARRPRSRAASERTGLPGSVRFLHVWAEAGTFERGAQAAGASAAAFCVGAAVPLLAAAFIHDYVWRLVSLVRARPGLWSCAPGRMYIDVSCVYRGWQYMLWDHAGPLAVDRSAHASPS